VEAMSKKSTQGMSRRDFLKLSAVTAIAASTQGLAQAQPTARNFRDTMVLLSEPILQLPAEDSVSVVWFSEDEGADHYVMANGERFSATTTKLERMFEDSNSRVRGRSYPQLTERDVYRHEARVTGLTPNQRVPYRAYSTFDGEEFESNEYSLQPLPTAGHPLKLLLSSDQQMFPMCAANYQKVVETVGMVDGVLFCGDFVSQPNRVSEWFDHDNIDRPAFFPSLQGTMRKLHPTHPYLGGEILQNAWLFGAVGNHEVPGRFRPESDSINVMDNDPQPRWFAELRYELSKAEINPTDDPELKRRWIEDNSFETRAYDTMWRFSEDSPGGNRYYAQQIGDVFVIVMNVSRIWRNWNPNIRGKFSERVDEAGGDLHNPEEWGFGDFIFEDFGPGSAQYQWLTETLQSDACRAAKYRIVLAHQSTFGLGDNSAPVIADPVVTIEYEEAGEIKQSAPFSYPVSLETWQRDIQPLIDARAIRYIRYEYPPENDIWRNHIEPLLLEHNVQLMHTGHSHVWNRSRAGAMHYLETSNVGNSFGAAWEDFGPRAPWAVFPEEDAWREQVAPFTQLTWQAAAYPRFGEPHGREIIPPTEANPHEAFENQEPFPFVSSNDVTVFSVLDTGTGIVTSYAFDTRYPTRRAVLEFDRFSLS
jgi:hypothetical protein